MLQSGIIELDVHSMNRVQAKTYIDSQLKRAKKDIINNEYWVYFFDDLTESIMIYNDYAKLKENGKTVYKER